MRRKLQQKHKVAWNSEDGLTGARALNAAECCVRVGFAGRRGVGRAAPAAAIGMRAQAEARRICAAMVNGDHYGS